MRLTDSPCTRVSSLPEGQKGLTAAAAAAAAAAAPIAATVAAAAAAAAAGAIADIGIISSANWQLVCRQ